MVMVGDEVAAGSSLWHAVVKSGEERKGFDAVGGVEPTRKVGKRPPKET